MTPAFTAYRSSELDRIVLSSAPAFVRAPVGGANRVAKTGELALKSLSLPPLTPMLATSLQVLRPHHLSGDTRKHPMPIGNTLGGAV